MILIAITGSFASGKSFLLNYLASMKFNIFSSDELVRDLYRDQDFQQIILNLIPNLKIFDKAIIAKLVYSDSVLRGKIQDIIHPLVLDGLESFKKKNSKDSFIFAEIPILFEAGLDSYFDFTITTFCSEKTRLERAKMRNNFDQHIYDQISNIQFSQNEKIARADFSVDTDTSVIGLEEQITKLIKKISLICVK